MNTNKILKKSIFAIICTVVLMLNQFLPYNGIETNEIKANQEQNEEVKVLNTDADIKGEGENPVVEERHERKIATYSEVPTPALEENFLIYKNSIYKYTGPTNIDLVIPKTIKGETVLGIGGTTSAFKGKSFTSVSIPDSVTSISAGAFQGCGISELRLPSGLEKIEENTFSSNQIISLDLPETLQSIGASAFAFNPLTELALPDSVTEVGTAAFSGCQLTKVKFSPNMNTIHANAFSSNKFVEIEFPNHITTIEKNAFQKNLQLNKVTLPANLKTIGDLSFQNCILTEVIMNDKLETIGNSAFEDNLITSIAFPNSLLSLGDSAFESNELTSVVIPDSVDSLGARCFSVNYINTLTLGTKITEIPDSCFYNNKFTTLVLPETVVTIGADAFGANLLASFELPSSVTTLGINAFANQRPNTTISKKDGAWFKDISRLDSSISQDKISNVTSSWGTYDSATKIMPLSSQRSKGDIAVKYNYQLKNDHFDNNTAMTVNLIISNYEYLVQFKNDTDVLSEQYITEGTAAVAPSDPKPPLHKTFAGWDKKFSDIKDELVVNATYENEQHTISLKEADGTLLSTIEGKYSELITKPTNPTKKGYDFAGWYKESTLATPWDFTTDIVDGDMNLYAKWTPKTYTITYENLNGTTTTNAKTYTIETNTIALTKPSARLNYTFEGYYDGTTSDAHKVEEITKGSSGDLTLYARWNVNKFKIKFENLKGAEANNPNEISVETGDITLTNPSELIGYKFKGWYDGENADANEIKVIDSNTTNDVKVYAHWNLVKYEVSYQGVKEGINNNVIDYTIESNEIILKAMPNTIEYVFTGWFESNDEKAKQITSIKKGSTGDIVLYARYSTKTYPVEFVDGDTIVDTKIVKYLNKYGELANIKKDGFQFVGWFSEKDGKGTQIKNDTSVEKTSSHQLYAYWKQIYFQNENGNISFDEGQNTKYQLNVEKINIEEQMKSNENLISVYDIYFLMNDKRVSIEGTKMMVTLNLKEEEKYFDHYKVLYLDADGNMVEEYIPNVAGDYSTLSFEVNHLSYYGIVAWKDDVKQNDNIETKSNEPKTGDNSNINVMTLLFILSSGCLLFLKNNKFKKNK